jgi:diguanylate cyclase (GGDEF)-like protein
MGGMEITNMPVGSLSLFDQDREEFAIVSQRGMPLGMLQRERYSVRSGGLTQLVLSSSKPTVIPDLKENKMMENEFLLNQGIRSIVAIPLVSESSLLGILYYDDVNPRIYPDYLLNQLSQFATEAVIAIQRHKAIAEVKNLSSRDTLTGLYNRSQMTMRLKDAIANADQKEWSVAIFVCDIDQFKKINEKFGYQYGDHVIKAVSESIIKATEDEGVEREEPLLFRSGVDEVTILLTNVDHERILQVAKKVRKAVQESGETVACPIDISIGVAVYPAESQSLDQMMTMASHSLLIAKKSDEKMCIGAMGVLHYPNPIRTIFEPVVDLGDNRVVGYEALSRDALGHLSILDLFKQYATLGQLPEIKNACFFAQIEISERLNLPRVFLNVDSTILHQCGWIQKPKNIEVVLEISEAESFHDFEAYLKLTEKWREKGFKFAIDDFGGGYVSLPFIARLKPDYIKVDRSVILQAVASPPFRVFLKSIIGALQKDQAIEIIAEGVETDEDWAVSREVGVPIIQGFLLKDKGYLPLSGSEKMVGESPDPS